MKSKSYLSDCLYFSSNALARSLTRLAEEAFHPVGLAPSYAFVLMTVNRKPGISPSKIAQELKMQPSTITRFLDKLQNRAYLLRETDGKKVKVYPTSKSQKINDGLLESWERLYERYHALLGDELAAMLSKEVISASEKLE